MAPAPDTREIVDALLAAEKRLTGEGEWQSDREGVKRFIRAIEREGEVTPLELVVKAYPRLPQPRFRIVLTIGRAIWRVDFTDELHTNPRNHGRLDIDPPMTAIQGPHYHSWADNRRFATATSLPERLRNARLLPDNVRSYESTLRWLCGATNIALGMGDVPDLPTRDTLI